MSVTKVKVNHHGLVYSGEYLTEGHSVSFIIQEDDVRVIENFKSGYKSSTIENFYPIDEAIEYQDKLIQLGYDKVS
tara:strand:- start:1339 stop:1566 length:228 start_codon:yes stop_codon:yes gene_type:complete